MLISFWTSFFARLVSSFYGFFVLLLENLKIPGRQLDADQLLYLIDLWLAFFLLYSVFPEGMIQSPGSMPGTALHLSRAREKIVQTRLSIIDKGDRMICRSF